MDTSTRLTRLLTRYNLYFYLFLVAMVEAAASGGRYGMVWWYWYQQAPLFTHFLLQYNTPRILFLLVNLFLRGGKLLLDSTVPL